MFLTMSKCEFDKLKLWGVTGSLDDFDIELNAPFELLCINTDIAWYDHDEMCTDAP